MVSETRKAHNMEKHFMYFLRRFRGLKEYEESYMERDHQRGVQFGRRSSNYKLYRDKADLHSCWEQLRTNPRIMVCLKKFEKKSMFEEV